ncbi:hypothetical protein QM646_51645, partial [Rhodococcus erythropolis]|nr:hypothetical protein [Rhodococcus erythropolis]
KIEECKVEQRAARKAYDAAVLQIGTAEGAYNTAVETLRHTLTETRSDAERLAPYARPDLLELLGVKEHLSWPA